MASGKLFIKMCACQDAAEQAAVNRYIAALRVAAGAAAEEAARAEAWPQ